jgi:hypothetical protein
MRRIRGLLATAAMTAFALLAWALPAQARATHATANCLISGTATTDPPVTLVAGRSGSYHFTEFRAPCAVETDETGPGGSPATGVVTLDITSDGTYDNNVCGTGTADDTANVGPDFAATSVGASEVAYTGTPGSAGNLLSSGDYGYHIMFQGGNGTLTFVHTDASRAAVSGSGEIQILPTPSEPQAPGDCTDRFQVNGHIYASL